MHKELLELTKVQILGKNLQSGRHLQYVLALILNKQGIDTHQSTAILIKQMV